MAAGLTAAAAMTVAAAVSSAPAAMAAARISTLSAGQQLQAGQELVSAGGQYALAMQNDGNLVIYGNGCVLWSSGTAGTGSNDDLSMQGDGNLVIYTSAGKAVWSSGTAGTGSNDRLVLQNDGSLVLSTSAGKAVWANKGTVASTGKTATSNLGVPKNCTWWAINEFHAFSGLYPYLTGNAKDYAASAASNGWTVTSTPQVNSIAVFPPGVNGADAQFGHVAWVTGISGSRITISEMNGPAGFGKTDTRSLTPASSVRYILAP
jgi:surface antigen